MFFPKRSIVNVKKEGFGVIELFGLIAFTVSFFILHFVANDWNAYSELPTLFMILALVGVGASLSVAALMWRQSRASRPRRESINYVSPDPWRDDQM